MTYIPHTIGKQYDPAHLRPFDLELAKAGHPLAWHDESEVTHLFEPQDSMWQIRVWEGEYWSVVRSANLKDCLRLAPLAIKHDPRTGKDEPLHVGDVIEVRDREGGYWKLKLTVQTPRETGKTWNLYADDLISWRWPVEVQG